MLSDEIISVMAAPKLFSEDLQVELLDYEEQDRQRLISLLNLRAKELGCYTDFKNTIKSFNKAQRDLENAYTRENRKKSKVELQYNADGRVAISVDNFLSILEGDPHFNGICFNLLTNSAYIKEKNGLRKWNDADDAETRRYIEKKFHIHNIAKCDDALRIFFSRHQFHPIRDMVESLKWDGTPRIEEFLIKWMGCEDNAYSRECSRLIFAGGINRLYRPGCKYDNMVVLIGTNQGEGKSTIVRWLNMKDEFSAEVSEFDGQKGIEAIEGAWICEVSELLAMTRQKDTEAVKAYLTKQNDRYRMPFDKRVSDHLRQCIFVGTTNKLEFLTDQTGNRRFLPIQVNSNGYELFDLEKECRVYIEQCWAESYTLFKLGKMPPVANVQLICEIKEHQEMASTDDPRKALLENYLQDKTVTSTLDIWRNAFGELEPSKPTYIDSRNIGLMMQNMQGWKRKDGITIPDHPEYGKGRGWRRINALEEIPISEELPF